MRGIKVRSILCGVEKSEPTNQILRKKWNNVYQIWHTESVHWVSAINFSKKHEKMLIRKFTVDALVRQQLMKTLQKWRKSNRRATIRELLKTSASHSVHVKQFWRMFWACVNEVCSEAA